MSTVNPVLQAAIDGVQDLLDGKRLLAASITVILYDWITTLSEEVRLLWRARWTTVKVIYLLNRYLLPVVFIFGNVGWSGEVSEIFSTLKCKIWVTADATSLLSMFASLHYVVSLRAWALWECDRWIGIFIWTCYVGYLVSSYTITIKSMLSIPLTVFPIVNVCFGSLPSFLWAIWLPSIVYESIIFLLTATKAVQHQRQNVETPILHVLYRDGFLYFIFISVVSFLNLMWFALAPETRVIDVKYFSSAVVSIAGAHLILDLLAVGHRTGRSVDSRQERPINNVWVGGRRKNPIQGPRDGTGENFEMMRSDGFKFRRSPETEEWSVANPDASSNLKTYPGAGLTEDDGNLERVNLPGTKPGRGVQWYDNNKQ